MSIIGIFRKIYILDDLPINVYSDGRIEAYDSHFISKKGKNLIKKEDS